MVSLVVVGISDESRFHTYPYQRLSGQERRGCELLNSSEGSEMIKANLGIARRPYKRTVWNPCECSWLIFQASGFGTSTCFCGSLKVEWNEILMTIILVLISVKKRALHLFLFFFFFFTILEFQTGSFKWLFFSALFNLTLKLLLGWCQSFFLKLCV